VEEMKRPYGPNYFFVFVTLLLLPSGPFLFIFCYFQEVYCVTGFPILDVTGLKNDGVILEEMALSLARVE